ncbi:MAG: hypothetical protein GY772_31040 [bacterium]|nr:hypothetical protein [bacterium]
MEEIAQRTQKAAQVGRFSSEDTSLPDTAEFQLRMFKHHIAELRAVAVKKAESGGTAFNMEAWGEGLSPLTLAYPRFVTKMLFSSTHYEGLKPFTQHFEALQAMGEGRPLRVRGFSWGHPGRTSHLLAETPRTLLVCFRFGFGIWNSCSAVRTYFAIPL